MKKNKIMKHVNTIEEKIKYVLNTYSKFMDSTIKDISILEERIMYIDEDIFAIKYVGDDDEEFELIYDKIISRSVYKDFIALKEFVKSYKILSKYL